MKRFLFVMLLALVLPALAAQTPADTSGVAANSDSVRKLMDARDRNRTALAEIDRNENREVSGYLTPVQQARYQMMREQLRRRIQEIREQRRRRSEMMGPRRAPGRPREA